MNPSTDKMKPEKSYNRYKYSINQRSKILSARDPFQRLFFITLLFFITMSNSNAQVDSIWQAYYDSTYIYWERDWDKTLQLLENGKNHLEGTIPDYQYDSTYNLTLSDIGLIYTKKGRYKDALLFYLEVLKNTEKSLGKDHHQYGMRLNKLAGLYRVLGRYDDALRLYLAALGNVEKSLGKDHDTYGLFLNDLALLYANIGRDEDALRLYLEALDNTEKSLSKEHIRYGTCLNNLAELYRNTGHYEEALPLYLESLEMTVKSVGKNHSRYGMVLNNLALLYKTIGRYEDALSLYLEALENTEKSLSKEHIRYGTCLNNLARLFQAMDRFEDALPLFLEGLKHTEKILGKDHARYGMGLSNLAEMYLNIGRYKEALPLILRAIEITEKSLGKDIASYGIQLNNLAKVHRNMGHYKEAIPLYLAALENIKKSLGEDHAEFGIQVNDLALFYQTMERYKDALPLILIANENLKVQIEKNFSISSEKNKTDFFKTLKKYFQQYYSFAYSSPEMDTLNHMFYNNELLLKSLILNSTQKTLAIIKQSGDTTLTHQFIQWRNVRRQLALQYHKPIKERIRNIDSLEQVANQLEEQLVIRSEDFMTSRREITWQEVRDNLKDGEAAIEFVSFKYFSNNSWTDSTIYVALLLTPEAEKPIWIDLFEENELANLFEQANSYKAEPDKVSTIYHSQTKNEYSAENIYELVWQPIENHLDGIHTIHFSASGLLHKVAFAPLLDETGESLLNKYQLNQLSSTRQLVLPTPKPVRFKQFTASIYGGIEYDFEPEAIVHVDTLEVYEIMNRTRGPEIPEDTIRSFSWSYLPYTEKESAGISKLLLNKKGKATYYDNQNATEAIFKYQEGILAPSILHLATHGYFYPDIEKKKNEGVLSTGQDFATYSSNPLLRSGIILANANYTWTTGKRILDKEDGILSALEISNLNLINTHLVVLSACNTALGDIHSSEGVFGLQRAFKMAGVDYLIVSLWKVDDLATSEFMISFYRNWTKKKNIYDAFRKTQLEMSQKYENEPYKWAAFVLIE